MDYEKLLQEMMKAADERDERMKDVVPEIVPLEPNCKYCNDSGWVESRHDAEGLFYKECPYCNLIDKLERKSKLSFANVPHIYRNNRIEDFRTDVYSTKEQRTSAETVLNTVKYWFEDFEDQAKEGRGLYFSSYAKGSGKTFLMSAIANRLLDMGREVKFATSLEILNEIKKTWERKNHPETTEREGDLLEQLANCEILIIDDFGTEQAKDWINDRFYSIINARYNNRKITCYTSNVPLCNLKYDERITSRIKGTCYAMNFPDEDVRTKIGREAHKELQNHI
jgi:DNA replication protein DnaC